MKFSVMYPSVFCTFILLMVGAVFSGNSPFSKVHVVTEYSGGMPAEEVIDLTVCIERTVDDTITSSPDYFERYEEIFKYFADGIYEMSNGANYLGNIRFFTGNHFWAACDIHWKMKDSGPSANTTAFTSGGTLNYSDSAGTTDRRDEPQAAASSLLHEAMHYIYGLGDEYGQSKLGANENRNDYLSYVDINTDEIVFQLTYGSNMSVSVFQRLFENYNVGSYVVFFPLSPVGTETPQLPTGLISRENKYSRTDRQNPANFHKISSVDRSQINNGVFRFQLENLNLVDAGSPSWGMRQPWNSSSVPHAVAWSSQAYYVDASNPTATHMIDNCGKEPSFQWWNFSTPYNARASSPHGMAMRDVNGNHLSQWEVVVQDPANDLEWGNPRRSWPRYHFKSLIPKAPKATDTYQTYTHINYDPATVWWESGAITWDEGKSCSDLTPIELPWMKVEIEGWDEAQKDAITRQYLNFIWMDQPSVEVKVLIDLSNSMQVHNKLDQAKLAAKYVSGGFLSRDTSYNVSNVDIELIGFNSTVQTIPIKTPAPGVSLLEEVDTAISSLSHSGSTAMYDAVSYGLSKFSSSNQSLKLMYVISDGIDNASTKKLKEVVSEYRKEQIAIHTFAYGKDAEKDALGAMARLTGGTFFDQEESLYLKVDDAVTTVLANAYNAQQSYAGSLGPQNATEQVLNLPSTAKRLLIMMEHQGVLNDHTVRVRTATGADLPLHADLDVINGRTFARLEADLSALSESDFPLSLVSTSQNWNVRVVSQYDQLPEYSMDVEVTPMGQVLYPKPVTLYSRVLKEGALVENAEYLVRVIRPDGSVVQKQFSPGLAPMRYTFMDYNAGGTYAWEIQSSSTEYSLVQNGQFVLEEFALDDHPAPPEDVSTMLPQENYGGIINFAGDADWFILQGLEQNQSYTVHFSAVEGDQNPQFSVYSPSDLSTPLYTGAGNMAGESRILSLGTDWSVNGGYIKIDGLAEGSKWEIALHKSKSSNIPVGRFEVASDWSSPHTTLSQSNILPAEGSYSLESTPGWRTISSRHVNTEELQVLASQIALDVSIPDELVNPWWVGNIELKVRVLSSNSSYTLGAMQELKAVQGGWQTYFFPVSDDLLGKMQEPHPDLVFDIQVNGPDKLRLDNMRFVGDLKFNTVAQWEQQCPGVGCSTDNPLDLGPVNHATTVVPYGDLYLQISQYPTDYVPQRIVVGISPEDGAELTGQLDFAGQTTSLSGWYQQLDFPFDGSEAMLFHLYNVGDRPYRITWWADGQAPVVAQQ